MPAADSPTPEEESPELKEMREAEEEVMLGGPFEPPDRQDHSPIEGGRIERRTRTLREELLDYELGSGGLDAGNVRPGGGRAPVARLRSRGKFDIPVVVNPAVMQFVGFFQNQGRKHFVKWLGRTSRYYPIMQATLRRYGLPEDLVAVALIESGLSFSAYSRARASGPWQFIQATGKRYGLNSDFWIDERRDFVKASDAAARHLRDLFARFGDWYLAWAAYNAGEHSVTRAIERVGSQDFWELADRKAFSHETRGYVPKILAAALIQKNPEEYAFSDIEYLSPLEWEEVLVEGMADLKAAARAVGISLEDIKELNPELRFWCSPPYLKRYTLRIPKGTKEKFAQNYRPSVRDNQVTFTSHMVAHGETLGHIALAYRISLEALMSANAISDVRKIRAGRSILIPVQPCGNPVQLPLKKDNPKTNETPKEEEDKPQTGIGL